MNKEQESILGYCFEAGCQTVEEDTDSLRVVDDPRERAEEKTEELQ